MEIRHTNRFFSKVEKTDSCWNWTAAKSANGYPLFWYEGRFILAHRFSYELEHGHIPSRKDAEIDHLCRNPICVNPEHLEAVTHRENVLRGKAPCADQAKQTKCKRGHEFSYFYVDKFGSTHRQCRICMTDNQRKRRAATG